MSNPFDAFVLSLDQDGPPPFATPMPGKYADVDWKPGR